MPFLKLVFLKKYGVLHSSLVVKGMKLFVQVAIFLVNSNKH